MQGVEGVEELFLSCFLSYYKLDIIDQQNIDVAVFLPEGRKSRVVAVTDRPDQFVGERFVGSCSRIK